MPFVFVYWNIGHPLSAGGNMLSLKWVTIYSEPETITITIVLRTQAPARCGVLRSSAGRTPGCTPTSAREAEQVAGKEISANAARTSPTARIFRVVHQPAAAEGTPLFCSLRGPEDGNFVAACRPIITFLRSGSSGYDRAKLLWNEMVGASEKTASASGTGRTW
jgi:hypothetical protein